MQQTKEGSRKRLNECQNSKDCRKYAQASYLCRMKTGGAQPQSASGTQQRTWRTVAKKNHDERKSYKITCKQSYHAQYFYHKEVRGSDDIERAAVLKYATRPFMAVLLMKLIVVVLFSGLENDGNASGSGTSRMPGRRPSIHLLCQHTWQLRGWEDFESPGLSLYWWKIKMHGFDWLS